MKKIVFILSAIDSARSIKRVQEFIAHGYNVSVYAYSRGNKIRYSHLSFDYTILGNVVDGVSYLKRIPFYHKTIKTVIEKEGSTACYYVFGTFLGIVFSTLWPRTRFFYEEGDMAHTYIKNGFVRRVLEWLDKRTVRKSKLSIFTSEGFIRYHFGDNVPMNVWLIPNRLDKKVLDCKLLRKKGFDADCMKIAFVGVPRFKAVVSFAEYFCKNYPRNEFHIYGGPVGLEFDKLKEVDNCYFHGTFVTPDDLPDIYSSINLVLSTYDVEFENVRYAEPNKLYEAVYFRTPIIVSKGTFLEEKVMRLGIGYSVDALNESSVKALIDSITEDEYQRTVNSISLIDTSYAINDNEDFFSKIEHYFDC